MRFLLIFFAVPIIEIACLIKVGESLGVLATLVALILSTVIGIYLLRIQGVFTLFNIQQSMQQGDLPTEDMLGGMLLAVAGILFVIPGFVSSSLGFIFLLPFVRRHFAKVLLKRSQTMKQGSVIIDGEYYHTQSTVRILDVESKKQDDQ